MGAACLGVPCAMKNRPALDAAYLPFAPWRDAYLKEAHRPVRIAVERQDGQVAVFDTRLRGVTDPADLRFLERTVKLLLWSVGGWRVRICGCDDLTRRLAEIYGPHGSRAFDASLMETVFRRRSRCGSRSGGRRSSARRCGRRESPASPRIPA